MVKRLNKQYPAVTVSKEQKTQAYEQNTEKRGKNK